MNPDDDAKYFPILLTRMSEREAKRLIHPDDNVTLDLRTGKLRVSRPRRRRDQRRSR